MYTTVHTATQTVHTVVRILFNFQSWTSRPAKNRFKAIRSKTGDDVGSDPQHEAVLPEANPLSRGRVDRHVLAQPLTSVPSAAVISVHSKLEDESLWVQTAESGGTNSPNRTGG